MLTGTGADEILIGGRGDDTIDGAGGGDVIIGGSGDDTIIYDAATDTLKVDAGTGTDILSVAGSGVTIDLTAIGDGVFEGFERIDLTGSGNNTLTLAVSDIYAITEDQNSLTGTGNTLVVDGNSGDAVDAGGGWVLVDDTVMIGPDTFTKYTQDAAILLVDNDVDQSAIGTVVPAVNLTDVANGTAGFKIIGENSVDFAGRSVSSAGDVNGDGFEDVIVGAPSNDGGGLGSGAAYVVFGSATPPTSVNLDDVAMGTGGFKINGEVAGDSVGISVSSAGDVNGDGIDDLIVGSRNNDAGGDDKDEGAAYVVFGATSGLTTVDLADVAAGTGGFKISGEASYDEAGNSVSSAGDINGDGFDDLIVGTYKNDGGGNYAGAAYVVFGAATGLTSVNLTDVAAGTGGFKITGETANDYAGKSVSSAGDVNGDGFDDLIVSGHFNGAGNTYVGAAYVVFGATSGITAVNLDTIALGTGGFKITGETSNDFAGESVASIGDVNGDGFDDIIVGAVGGDAGGGYAGAAYVVFGAAGGITAVDLDTIALGTGGFKITGEALNDRAGLSVASAGDVNGDGFDDMLVGAAFNDAGGANAGAAYVVFGAASGITSVDLDNVAAGTGGFKIIGEVADDLAGLSVSSAGDVDGDGFDDLIVGASRNDAGDTYAGAAYVVFGADFTGQVDFLGTDGNDSLTGTGANEILIGGRGDDTIDGAGGGDVIIGGSGNDTIIYDAATDTLKVDAGTGTDILSVSGSGVTIDLTAINDGVFEGFERIDLTGSGNNTLTLAVSDIYAITEDQNSLTGTGNTLVVDGNAGDAVDAGGGWVLVDNAVDIGGTFFTQYTQDAATLYVDNAVDQSAIGLVSPQIDLADVANGTGGFKIIGENSYDKAGFSVSSAGDVNGDGFDDVIVGAIGVDAVINGVGAAYVVFGTSGGLTSVNLDTIAAGTGGFKIIGEGFNNDNAGWRVSGAGDVNGDGIDDLIVSSVFNGNSAGAAYVVFGATSGLASLNLADVAAGTGGFKIIGENVGDQAGTSVSSAGDVNGDGIDDLLIGAWHNYAAGPKAGAAYVVFGDTSVTTAVNLDDVANGTGGFRIVGEMGNDYAGFSVSSAGDVNGDGVDDVIVGAFGEDTGGSQAGAAYVVYGATGGFSSVNLNDVAGGTGGFKITGETAFDRAGWSVSSAGDVNGDGFDDLIIGAYRNDAGGDAVGAAYVVFGAASGLTSVDLVDIAGGTGGFKIFGEADDDKAGKSVSGAGDVNGDGFDDLIIGASENDEGGLDSGAAYVVFGGAGMTSVNLDDVAAGIGGFKIIGEAADDDAGYAVSVAGDIDGDGFDDLIVGARDNNSDGLDSGAAYVIYGTDFTGQVDFLGTDGNDSLTGTGANEILIGGQGDDTIDGAGGDDVIIGGSGNDTIIYDAATDTLKVDAGTGTDILSVAGSGVTIDLTAIADGVFEGFERIDLTGAGNNSLILAVSDIYAITEDQNADTLTGNTLIVDGNAGDTVNAGFGWTLIDDAVVIGLNTFTKYTQDAATILVDNDVDQSAFTALPPIALTDVANGTGGFAIVGENATDNSAYSVSAAGDVNGDGFEDVIVGAHNNVGGGGTSGAAYVVFGAASGLTAVDLGTIALGTGGFKILGENGGDQAGIAVSSVGDVNGDGIDDVIVGATFNDAGVGNAGAAYVVFGASGGLTTVDLDNVALGTGGFRIIGEVPGDEAGVSVSAAGDVNGDGIDDLIIGAKLNDAGDNLAGAAYVVFGAAGGITAVDLSDIAAGTGGFKIIGEAAGDLAGRSVSSVGDVNGDGFDDVIVGAAYNDAGGNQAGAAYVVFGAASGITAVNLDTIALGTGGFKIIGSLGGDTAGVSVSSAGDLDGDGFDDLLVGATGVGGGGAAYVVFGRDFTGQVDFLGTTGNDSLTGTAADEILIGGQGDDTIDGGGGDDVIIGGSGDDTIIYDAATDTLKVDGGTGTDILTVAGSGVIVDLTAINDGVFEGFERIDLTGSGNNTLVLKVADLYAITDDLNADAASATTLIVDGNAGDVVDAAAGWTLVDNARVIGLNTYTEYSQDAATLLVDNTITQAVGLDVGWTNGTANGSWHTAGNWDLGVVPPDNSDVTITDQTSTVTYSTGTTVLNDLDLVDETLTITGGVLTVEGEFTEGASATLILDGGTLNVSNDTLTANGTISFSGGTIAGGKIQTSGTTTLDFENSQFNILDGVTLNGDVDLSVTGARFRVQNSFTLNTEGGVAPGSLTLSGQNSAIGFQGTQTFDDATVLFDASTTGSKILSADAAGMVLTLGPNLTISGGLGFIQQAEFVGGATTIINQGTISADDAGGQGITIRPSTFSNENAIEAINGSFLTITAASWTNEAGATITATGGSTLTFQDDWNNLGTVTVTSSTVVLGGTFSTADIGTLTRSGGTVTLTGDLDNTSDTLTFNTASGSWEVSGATINNGIIQYGDGEGLNFGSSTSTILDGVTLNGAVDLSATSAKFRVQNTLTLNAEGGGSPGSLTLSGSNSTIAFEGIQTFDNATVLFDTTAAGNKFLSAEGTGAVLTLGSNVVISGGQGFITQARILGGATTIINQGTISANVSAKAITIRPANFDNEATVEATGGGSLSITSATSFINDGSVTITGGGTLTISAGSWTNLAAKTITATNSSLTLGGAWDNDGTITVTDSTVVLGGTFSTADIGTLTRSGGTVTLTGDLDNTSDTLTFNTASGSWEVSSATINNGIIQYGDGEGLNFGSSTSTILDGVTLNGAVDLSATSAKFRVQNTLTLNAEGGGSPGSLTLSGSNSTIAFEGIQTFDNATVLFDTTAAGNKFLSAEGTGAVLTLGSNVVISGGQGFITQARILGGATTIISLGLIAANVSAKAITISPSNFDNQGTITLSNGGLVTMTVASADYTSSGTINVLGGGDLTINFSGTTPTFTNESGASSTSTTRPAVNSS